MGHWQHGRSVSAARHLADALSDYSGSFVEVWLYSGPERELEETRSLLDRVVLLADEMLAQAESRPITPRIQRLIDRATERVRRMVEEQS